MKSASAKTVTICEKETEPDVLNNTSQCSCVQCDSYHCYALRNRTPCSCDKYPTLKDKINNMDSFVKEFTYDNSNNYIKTINLSNNSCVSSDSKGKLKKRNMGSTELSNSRTHHCKEFNFGSNTAQLSAQIMNLPYKEFRESISHNKSDSSVLDKNTSKLSKLDIFSRIKDAYKECSCKVCECIVGKATNDFCKCKPCECHDCVALSNNFKFGGKQQLGQTGCPCVRCHRKGCKGLVKKSLSEPSYCDCGPCDCITCLDNYNEPCNCTPCECIECKSYSTSKPWTVIVGRVGEDAPRNLCSCSPCDCAECGLNYPAASSLRREISTGINRPANCNCDSCLSQSCETNDSNTCTCEIQKQLMRKPVEKDTRDYDIHRASINNNNLIEKRKSNTIAMYTALGKNSTTFKQLGNTCYCSECECIICSGKDKTANAIKASRLFEPLEETPSELNNNTCNCLSCECEVCSENNRSIGRDLKSCTCDVCDCLKCEGLIRFSQKNNKDRNKTVIKAVTSNKCKCKPCQCADCKSMMYNCTGRSCCCSNCKCEVCIDQTKRVTSVKVESNKNYIKSNNNDYRSDSNERIKVSSKKEYVKKINMRNISKSDGMNRRKNFTCEVFMQNDKADVLLFDRGHSEISNASESFTSKSSKPNVAEYYNDEFTLFTKSETVKSNTKYDMNLTPGRLNIIESSSISTTNKCLNEVMNTNMDDYKNTKQINVMANIVPNEWAKETLKEQNICDDSDSIKVLTMAHAEVSSKIDIEKPSTIKKHISDLDIIWELKEAKRDSRKQILNMKQMSQELAQSLRDANRKYANIKCNNCETDYKITSDDFTAKDLHQTTFEQSVPNDKIENNEVISSNLIDFKKINYNLQEAKAFSLELLSILKQYQNANNQFRNNLKFDCSKRFHSNVDLVNCKEKKTQKAPVRVTTNGIQECRQLKSNLPSDVIKNKNGDKFVFDREPECNLRLETNEKNIFQRDKQYEHYNFHYLSNNDYTLPTTSNNTELIDYLLNGQDKEPFQSMYKQSYEYVTNQENAQKYRLDVNHCTNGSNKINSSLNQTGKLKPIVDRIADNNTNCFRHDTVSETLVPSKEIDIKQSLAIPQTYSLQTGNLETIHKICNPFDINGLVKHKQYLNTSTSTFTLEESDNILNELQEISGARDVKHWSIFKKNMNLYSSPFTKNKDLCLIPTLTLEVKNVLKSISAISGQFNEFANDKTSTNIPVSKGGNSTLSGMAFKDQNYFFAASSQTFQLAMIEEKGINCRNDESEAISSKNNCEAMKAKFLGLRRVSDHTVLVKWKTPKDLNSVQGYELLVDGRAVQKILSPSRCMAVVSCLPHLDQVLITIRTIVTPAQQCEHLPTATVVYQPRLR